MACFTFSVNSRFTYKLSLNSRKVCNSCCTLPIKVLFLVAYFPEIHVMKQGVKSLKFRLVGCYRTHLRFTYLRRTYWRDYVDLTRRYLYINYINLPGNCLCHIIKVYERLHMSWICPENSIIKWWSFTIATLHVIYWDFFLLLFHEYLKIVYRIMLYWLAWFWFIFKLWIGDNFKYLFFTYAYLLAWVFKSQGWIVDRNDLWNLWCFIFSRFHFIFLPFYHSFFRFAARQHARTSPIQRGILGVWK